MSSKIADTPLMRQYMQLKQKHPDAILLFRVGDFYETFSDDAVVASEILGITLTRRANGTAMHVELAGFPHHALDSYLPKLVRAGKRVAICDQLEDPKLVKNKKLVKRGITELVTPGVVMGDNVLKNKENNYLAAIHWGKPKLIGLSLVDISTGEFLVIEERVEQIVKLLSLYQPKEVLVERRQRPEYDALIGYNSFVFEMEDWNFSIENNRDRLCQHFGVQSLKGFGVEGQTEGIAAAGAVLNYLLQTSHEQLGHITKLRRIDSSTYARIDNFTLRSLELLQPMNREGKSLLDIIDYTHTPMGGRLLRKWIVFPLLDIALIQRRQAVVSALVEEVDMQANVVEQLQQIGDLERLASKAVVGRINPREVNQLYEALMAVDQIKTIFVSSPNEALGAIGDRLPDTSLLTQRINRIILPNAPIALGRGPVIASGVDPELDELRSLSTSGKDYLLQIQQRESEQTGIPSLKIAFNNVFGYYIEVRNAHKDKVPEGWIRKQTLVSAERYITQELKEYEEKILGAEEKISSIETRLFGELVSEIVGEIQPIQQAASAIAQLDCLSSLSTVARLNRYVRPEVNDSQTLRIEAGRHPVIERQLPPGESYIPNDIYLDNDSTQIIIITGPNMSGKSALLRQTALIVLLAQIGSFVPATSASIGIVDGIFTRVGASDNISRGESTFMVEMQEASNILNNISPRSLVLFDELGRGTSTYDGISIAWAIIEYLHGHRDAQSKTLFATHYHELNEIEQSLERVKNFNVSAREIDGKMLFLRKLEPGGSEHSFGIQVAKLGGMPRVIVDRASQILSQLEQESAQIETPEVKGAKSTKGKVKDQEERLSGIQMSFFQLDDPVLDQIREALLKVDINNLTPIEALNKLNDIRNLLGH